MQLNLLLLNVCYHLSILRRLWLEKLFMLCSRLWKHALRLCIPSWFSRFFDLLARFSHLFTFPYYFIFFEIFAFVKMCGYLELECVFWLFGMWHSERRINQRCVKTEASKKRKFDEKRRRDGTTLINDLET